MIRRAITLMFSLLAMAVLGQGAAEARTELWAKLLVDAYRRNPDGLAYVRAMRVAEQYGEHDPRLHVAIFGAACSMRNYNPARAESLFKRDIADLETIDPDFPEIPCDCFELAKLYLVQSRFSESEAQLRRAIAIRNKWQEVSSNNPFNAELWNALYLGYYSQGATAKANEAYDQMLKVAQQLRLGVKHTECLGMLRYRIHMYTLEQRRLSPEQARHLNEIALAFAGEEAAGLRKEGKIGLIADQLHRTAEIEYALGDYKKSEGMVRESLDLVRNNLDLEKEYNVLQRDTELLSQILIIQHRYHEAVELEEQLLSVNAQAYGRVSKTYAQELTNWVAFWQSAGHPEFAKNWKSQAEEIRKKLD